MNADQMINLVFMAPCVLIFLVLTHVSVNQDITSLILSAKVNSQLWIEVDFLLIILVTNSPVIIVLINIHHFIFLMQFTL